MAKQKKRPTVGSGATATDGGIVPAAGGGVSPVTAGAAGSAAGAASGAMIGTVAGGPPGTLVGALAGALGGWWAGHGAAHAASEIGEHDDHWFRSHFETSPDRLADRSYDHARPAYQVGHLAAAHPEWEDREFEAAEADLQKGWTDELRLKYGDWAAVRPFAREGWRRRRGQLDTTADARRAVDASATADDVPITTQQAEGGASWGEHMEGQPRGRVNPAQGLDLGGSPSHQRPSFSDPIAAIADDVAGGVDPDGRVERIAAEGERTAEPDLVAANQSIPLSARDSGESARQRTRGAEIATPRDYLGNPRPSTSDPMEVRPMSDTDKNVKTNNVLHHDDRPGAGDHVGEAAGGISGVLAGAAIGSAGGPVGTIIGGIVGAMSGWWTGRTVSEAATNITHSDDDYYKSHYESSPNRMADRSYDHVRPAYHLGHLAAHNPDYKGRDWDYVEQDLQKGWAADNNRGDWTTVRDYAREGYTRGGSATGTARTATDRAFYGAGMATGKAEGLADRAGDAAANAGHKIANAADNLKDRVDGNPASKPGPDATDRRF